MKTQQHRSARARAAAAVRGFVAVTTLFAHGVLFAQAINDIPMAVKNNVAPNFMFMLDNSLSMEHVVVESPYSVNGVYTASCPAATTGSNNIEIPAANAVVELRIASGVPYARVANTDRRHTSVTTTGNRVCFNNASVYRATLDDSMTTGAPALYTGHYLNWYFGNYGSHPTSGWSDRKPLSGGSLVRNRIDAAKQAATSVLNSLSVPASGGVASVRAGLSTYYNSGSGGGNTGDGGQLIRGMADFTTTHRTNLVNDVAALTLSGFTPLAETLGDIGRYFSTGYSGNVAPNSVVGGSSVTLDAFLKQGGSSTGRNSCLFSGGNRSYCTTSTSARPVTQWCQRSFAILLTDGRNTQDRGFADNTYLRDYDGDCAVSGACGTFDRRTGDGFESDTLNPSGYLDDVAKALKDIDLRPDLQPPLLPDGTARLKPDGTPFVKSVDAPNNMLTYAIAFADEEAKNDPLLKRAATQGGGRFESATTTSELIAAFNKVIVDASAKDAAAAAVAVANAQITLNNIGYASSYKSGSWYGDLVAYSLDTTSALQTGGDLWSLRTNLDAQAPGTRKIATYNGSTGVAFAAGLSYTGKPAALTDAVINYLRGDRTGEGSTVRQRQSVLGDIINAEPVVVTYPGNVPIIFQGANDGMLHVVDGRIDVSVSTRGQELWAYVPKLVHADLHELTDPNYTHRYYIDGTPATAEITGVTGVSRILVGGLGKGGRGYYALNISSYEAATQADAAAKVLWEFTPASIPVPAEMGYSFGAPLIVRTAAGWRVLVTSGYQASGNGRVWVLDPADGSVEATLDTGVSNSGLAHLGKLANTAPDALVRYVWGGDVLGNVWRFDLDTSSVVKIASLTDAGGTLTQPVTSPPEVGLVSGSSTKFVVMVGTGRYLADEDVPGAGANAWATQRQTVYGLFDDTTVASPTLPNLRGTNGSTCPSGGGNGDLVCQSLTYNSGTNRYSATTNAVNPASRRGWYVDLPSDANMANARVVSKPSLTAGGTLALTVNIPTNVPCDPGGRSWFLALAGATGGAVPRNIGGNTYFDAGYFLGYALASRTVIVTTSDGKRALIRMSDKTVQAPSVPESATSAATWRRIYWRSVKN